MPSPASGLPVPGVSGRPVTPEGTSIERVDVGWELRPDPGGTWLPAQVPGTVAGAHVAAGRDVPVDLDDVDWLLRTRLRIASAAPGEQLVLRLQGVATLAQVRIDGELVATSRSMHTPIAADITALVRDGAELEVRCAALGPVLSQPRRPRARWRPALAPGGLRFIRTALVGRAPGLTAGAPVIGCWRDVQLERRRWVAVDDLQVSSEVVGEQGLVRLALRVEALDDRVVHGVQARVRDGSRQFSADLTGGDGSWSGQVSIPRPRLWWPHTHGEPALADVELTVATSRGPIVVPAGQVGFRTLTTPDIETEGLSLRVNDIPVFVRGAVWVPAELAAAGSAGPDRAALSGRLEQVRAAGLNLLRVVGTGSYETPEFFAGCDRLGLLVWQDLMFANFDYPAEDAGFLAEVTAEVTGVLDRVGGSPCLAVVCGNSEVEQQVAMLGLDPALGRGALFGELFPRLVADRGIDAIYVASSPVGAPLPMRPSAGLAHWFGVGGYRRPLSDTRLAAVRFAAECLALSNVPDSPGVAAAGGYRSAAWLAGVPRDAGADWSFEEVRDHYTSELFGVDVKAVQEGEPERYLALSRVTSGQLLSEVFGEWRRPASPCSGGVILWWRDLRPGAGWGLIDAAGQPKSIWWAARRALAPVAVWTTDEGLGGVDVHVANDQPEPVVAELRVATYRGELPVREGRIDLELPPHSATSVAAETVLGGFVDVSYAYRFGPPGADLVVAALSVAGDRVSEAFRFPVGLPAKQHPPQALGLAGGLRRLPDGAVLLDCRTTAVALGVQVNVPGFVPADNHFHLPPGGRRLIRLTPTVAPPSHHPAGTLTAANMAGNVALLQS